MECNGRCRREEMEKEEVKTDHISVSAPWKEGTLREQERKEGLASLAFHNIADHQARHAQATFITSCASPVADMEYRKIEQRRLYQVDIRRPAL